ncbi:MAG: ATP-binding protein, partial [Massilimicrobiota timonensis]
MSNALGVHACRSRKRVKYIRLPELLMDLETARIQGTYRKMMKQLGKLDLLIIDEFLLSSVNETEVN